MWQVKMRCDKSEIWIFLEFFTIVYMPNIVSAYGLMNFICFLFRREMSDIGTKWIDFPNNFY